MKTLLLFFLLAFWINIRAQVAINADGAAPDNSAMLDVKSTAKGFLPPRMTLAQRNALVSPAKGLMIFQTDVTPGIYFNTGTSTTPAWTFSGSSTGQWLTNGTSIYYNNGNVGIGTSSPTHPLIVKSSVLSDDIAKFINGSGDDLVRIRQNSNGSGAIYIYDVSGVNNIFLYGDGNSFIRGGRLALGHNAPMAGLHLKGTAFPESFMYIEGAAGNDAGLRIYENGTAKWHLYNDVGLAGLNILNNAGSSVIFAKQSNGYVGIGTDSPVSLLDVRGNVTINNSGRIGVGITVPVNSLDVRGTASILTGYLGIGTTTPSASLHVKGTAFPSSFIIIESSAGSDGGIRINEGTAVKWSIFNDPGTISGLNIYNSVGTTALFVKQSNSYVAIQHKDPEAELDIKGNIIVRDRTSGEIAVELGTGLDYAEGFNISDQVEVLPGMVMSIDPENPGKLKTSTSAFDHKVAGIVAGANQLGSGITLGSGSHQINVALAGRVYCNADAMNEAITTGDLLTTSDIPGHAMKASDSEKSRGAILGKAMGSLEKGKTGKILVLVTLQ